MRLLNFNHLFYTHFRDFIIILKIYEIRFLDVSNESNSFIIKNDLWV